MRTSAVGGNMAARFADRVPAAYIASVLHSACQGKRMVNCLPRFCLRIPTEIFSAMLAHAQTELPNECVGLLAGIPEGVVVQRYPLVNVLADPQRFESEPRSMFLAEKARRAAGLEFLAVYHSHPTSPPTPSKHDLAWHYSPDVQCVIISLAGAEPEVRAFWLAAEQYEPAAMEVVSQPALE